MHCSITGTQTPRELGKRFGIHLCVLNVSVSGGMEISNLEFQKTQYVLSSLFILGLGMCGGGCGKWVTYLSFTSYKL